MEVFDVVIVGSGVSGLQMGVRLKMAGLDNFVIFDKAERVGGTWNSNRYPHLTCDMNSMIMCHSWDILSLSYAKEQFSPPVSFQSNMERIVSDFDLNQHLRLGVRVTSAVWTGKLWCVDEKYECKFLIRATGMQSEPYIPTLPGLQTHPSFCHSSEWKLTKDDLKGKRIAVVGTGASGMQMVTGLRAEAKHVYVFQSKPMWIMPRFPDDLGESRYSKREASVLATVCDSRVRYRMMHLANQDLLFHAWVRESELNLKLTETLKKFITSMVPDKTLAQQLTPTYPFGATRPLRDTDPSFYESIRSANVTLIPCRVDRVEGNKIWAADQQLEIDHFILATGFKVASTHFKVEGLRGSLEHCWGSRPFAYLGITVPDFPNFFIMYGPNSYMAHTAEPPMLEAQSNFILNMISGMSEARLDFFHLRKDVLSSWLSEVDSNSKRLTITSDIVDSWFTNQSKENFTTYPGTLKSYFRRTVNINPNDYIFFRGAKVKAPPKFPTYLLREPFDTERDCPFCGWDVQDVQRIQLKNSGERCFKGSICPCCSRTLSQKIFDSKL